MDSIKGYEAYLQILHVFGDDLNYKSSSITSKLMQYVQTYQKLVNQEEKAYKTS